MTPIAEVGQIWVFPVKSMSGTPLDRVDVDAGGLVGDRSWAVVDESGATVTAAAEPRLREVVPRLDGPELRLDVPGAEPGLDALAAAEALSGWLGRPLRLDHRGGGGFADVAPVHLVSSRSIADATHAADCDACDVAAPRANLVLDLAPGAASERDWVGRALSAGAAGLQVVRLPTHCLGAYADVSRAGTIAVGDEVDGR